MHTSSTSPDAATHLQRTARARFGPACQPAAGDGKPRARPERRLPPARPTAWAAFAAAHAPSDDAFHGALALCRVDPAAAQAAAAADLADPATPPEERRRLCLFQAIAALRAGDRAAGILALQRILAEGPSQDAVQLHALSELAVQLSEQGDSGRAVELYQEAVRLARRRGDAASEARNLLNLGFTYGERAEAEPYAAHSAAAMALFDAQAFPLGRAMARVNLAGALVHLGRYDEAEGHYDLAEEIAAQADLPYARALCEAGRGALCFRRGDPAGGAARYAAANARLEAMGRSFQVARHHYLVGELFWEAGDLPAAAAALEEALRRAQAGGFKTTASRALQRLSIVREAQGDLPAAIAALRARDAVQQAVFDDLLAARLEAAGHRHAAEAARLEAAFAQRRSAELAAHNEELTAALRAQEALQQRLLALSNTDPLTGLPNRRQLRAQLDAALASPGRPCALLILDLDHFKTINDRYGHESGDAVLIELAIRLVEAVGPQGTVARWGGEEFCLLLPGAPLDEAAARAEAIRQAIAAAPFTTPAGPVAITASIGLSRLDGLDAEAALRLADAALFRAKRRGRDRVERAAELPSVAG